ncbi:nuclease [Sporothrix epigloea]|uniref:Endonuclease n=1 Tax=Sporothrix epigloea TaxID=1892477 RepID=A0ABP0DNL7_9PEZI
MSKSTIAVIAAVSAGTGAAVTAAMYSLRSKPADRPTAVPTTVTTVPVPAAPSTPSSAIVPAAKVFSAPPPAPVPTPAPVPLRTQTPAAGAGPVDPAGLFQYGFPGPVADIASRSALVSAYDRRTRNPHWVAEHITPASLAARDGDRGNSNFVEDTAVPELFRAKLKDYFRSGYDRGHQVPAADCKWSQEAMNETFFLTNMCPQVGEGFNRDYWAHFEDFCRRLTARYPSVRVVTGPLYLPKRDPVDNKWYVKYEMIGSPPAVAVPTHFYKVIYAETVPSAGAAPGGSPTAPVALGAFVLPNAPIPNDKPLTDFEVPLEAVERASGLEFASKLPVQRRRRLCAEASCSLVIKEYGDRQKAFAKGGKK